MKAPLSLKCVFLQVLLTVFLKVFRKVLLKMLLKVPLNISLKVQLYALHMSLSLLYGLTPKNALHPLRRSRRRILHCRHPCLPFFLARNLLQMQFHMSLLHLQPAKFLKHQRMAVTVVAYLVLLRFYVHLVLVRVRTLSPLIARQRLLTSK